MSAHPTRRDYASFSPLDTRFHDNDAYGHINNVVYYAFFDTVINRYLIDNGLSVSDPIVGYAVESSCKFIAPLRFPQRLEGGLRVAHLGTSSVRYEVGIFAEGADVVSAHGYFVHVFVARSTHKATPIPDPIRAALARLVPS